MTLDFTAPCSTAEANVHPQGLSDLKQVFYDQIDQQKLHPAAQLVVVRQGKVILDLAHGQIHSGQSVTPETPFFTFSVTKAFTGICIHHLIENGLIEMDAPVADYWPEFAQKGKASATIRHVFLHLAGIPSPQFYRQVLLWPFWNLAIPFVARTPAAFPPGEKMAYHAVNYGFIFGEVVRRVTGQMIDQYLQEHFLTPLKLENTWMRIPPTKLSLSPRLYSGDKSFDTAAFIFNRRLYRTALIPAAGLHSCARDLAIFYQMLLNYGEYDGVRYLQEETIKKAIAPGFEGLDELSQQNTRWAYGFHLNQIHTMPDGTQQADMGFAASKRAFGHYGMASCVAFADPEADLVVAFTCNRLISDSSQRAQDLLNTLWKAIQSPPYPVH